MRRGWRVLLPALALALACQEGRPATDPAIGDAAFELDPRFDPQLTAVDLAAPHTRFDGGFGSLIPGGGWAPAQDDRPRGEVVPISWAVGEEATIGFERPPAAEVDLWGDCRPLHFEGAPRQQVTVSAGGEVLARATLDEGWHQLRMPLPQGALEPGWNQLRLRFAYARKPKDVLPGNDDDRRLAIACQALALVPRAVDDVPAFLDAAELDPSARRLRLPLGGQAAFALPAGSTAQLRLGRIRLPCRRCGLRAELVRRDRVAPGPPRLIWDGAATGGPWPEIPFPTPGDGISRLRLAFYDGGGEVYDAGQIAEIELPPDFLTVTRGPAPEAAAERPVHVFVYLIDTLRADALLDVGVVSPAAPRVFDFARDAVVYGNVWTASSWTLPSVVSILTGVYPHRHGVMTGKHRFSADTVPSLAARLDGAGYDTFGVSQSLVASSRFGVDAGFGSFVLDNQLSGSKLRSQAVRRHLLSLLLRRPDPQRPIFGYLHTVDPHAPYTPVGADRRFAEQAPGKLPARKYRPHEFMAEHLGDDPGEVAHLRALYRGEVAYADREFGRFVAMLRHLGLYDDSLIVLLSDHGEEFGEHGGFDHGRTVYEEMLRVPLVIKYPRSQWAGTEIAERVSTVDLVPTILRVAGVDAGDPVLDGVSLRPPDLAARDPARRVIFSEVSPVRSALLAAVDYRALAVGDLKCVESLSGNDQFGREIPRWQSFDLGRDPAEAQPLASDAEDAERCRGLLERWWQARQQLLAEGARVAVDEEALERLRALGYID